MANADGKAMMRKSKPTRAEAHVRLYSHELESPAYQSLNNDSRALLVEFRSLYSGRENRIYMSTREAMRRINVGQYKAERAIGELLDRGFLLVLEKGSFSRKGRHATVYALTNEPITQRDGDTAPKDFMRWQPQKNTVRVTSTVGKGEQYRELAEDVTKEAHGKGEQYRKQQIASTHGKGDHYTDRLPGGTGEARPADHAYDWWKMALFQASGPQFKSCLWLLALNYPHEVAA